VNGGIVARLRLTPVLIHYDEMGYPQTDYEACKRYINDQGVKLMREAADEIERLRNEKEQDEAKIWVADKEIERLESERNEAIVLANAVIRSASALITFKIPAAKASSYWNAVDEFRRFDERTT
jgi:hypothetical protein